MAFVFLLLDSDNSEKYFDIKIKKPSDLGA